MASIANVSGPIQSTQRRGGARLTRTLLIVVGSVLAGAALVMTVALHSATQLSSSSAVRNDGNEITPAEQSEAVRELEASGRPPVHAALKTTTPQPPPAEIMPQASTPPPIPQPPSRFTEWSKDEYMKALSAPPLIEAFHKGQTLQIPSQTAQQTGGTEGLTNTNPYQSSVIATAQLHRAESPYLITAGSVIPAVLISGINSDLPGPILGQVRENVFDTATGRWVLLPQGTKLIGSYKNDAGYGQQRVQIAWKRLVFPNASSMDLPEMPGADAAGYAGFNDQVNNHYAKTFGTAALLSVISAGQMVGQMGAFGGGTGFSGPYGYGYTTPNQFALLGEMGGASASQQLGQVGQNSIQRGMNIPPTLEIRPGYEFNVMVTNDLVLPGPYRN